MSGESTLRKARRMKWQNSHYMTNAKFLGLDIETWGERRKALRDMSAEHIVQKLPMFENWSPTLDGSYISDEADLGMMSDARSSIARPKWCERIMIGDTAQDVRMFCDDFMEKASELIPNREQSSKAASWTILRSWTNFDIP